MFYLPQTCLFQVLFELLVLQQNSLHAVSQLTHFGLQHEFVLSGAAQFFLHWLQLHFYVLRQKKLFSNHQSLCNWGKSHLKKSCSLQQMQCLFNVKLRFLVCICIFKHRKNLPAELSASCPTPCGGTVPSSPAAASELQPPSASAPPPTLGLQPESAVRVRHKSHREKSDQQITWFSSCNCLNDSQVQHFRWRDIK